MEQWLSPVRDQHLGKFNTLTGREIDINSPKAEDFNTTDIAMGLANYCRFGGQIRRHYSVAQHSLLVMFLAPEPLKRAALIHDAVEAYLGDVISPLKKILGSAYKDIEHAFTEKLCERYGVTMEELAEVKPYDMQALEIEHLHLREGQSEAWDAIWKENNLGFQSYDPNPETWYKLYYNYFIALFNN